jgi:hypothetical protein
MTHHSTTSSRYIPAFSRARKRTVALSLQRQHPTPVRRGL